MTALLPGQSYSIALAARDLASNTRNASVTHTSPALAYQADALDIGYFSSGPSGAAQWRTGTQMYAGTAFVDPLGTVFQRHLGAWMFRIPETAIDPNTITGAVVEATGRHNWVVQYTADPQIHGRPARRVGRAELGDAELRRHPRRARTRPVSSPRPATSGAAGRSTPSRSTAPTSPLSRRASSTVSGGERKAAFRYQATDSTSRFALLDGLRVQPPLERAGLEAEAAALHRHELPDRRGLRRERPGARDQRDRDPGGLRAGSVTVTWRTDNVSSDSFVLFREQGTPGWTQVGTLARTRLHQVQVQGLDSSKRYEFVVRSRACNGATTTDTNAGAGYDFYRHAPDPGPRTEQVDSTTSSRVSQGWTVTHTSTDQTTLLASKWTRGTPGSEGPARPGWHVADTVTGLPSYYNFNETTLTSPVAAPITFGGRAGISWLPARYRQRADIRLPLRRVLRGRRGDVDGGGALRRVQRLAGLQPGRSDVPESG